jgi:hypothetical protein
VLRDFFGQHEDRSRAPLRRAGTDLWYRPLVQTSGTDVRQDLAVEREESIGLCRRLWKVWVDRNVAGLRNGTSPHGTSIAWPEGAARPTPQRNQSVDKNDGAPLFAVRPLTSIVGGTHRRDDDAHDTRAGSARSAA